MGSWGQGMAELKLGLGAHRVGEEEHQALDHGQQADTGSEGFPGLGFPGRSLCWPLRVLGGQPGAKHHLLSDVLSIRTDVQGEQRRHHLDSTPSGRTEGRSGKELSLLRQEASRTV